MRKATSVYTPRTSVFAKTSTGELATATSTSQEMVGPNGLEPSTSSVSGRRSTQLSYGPTVYCGDATTDAVWHGTTRRQQGMLPRCDPPHVDIRVARRVLVSGSLPRRRVPGICLLLRPRGHATTLHRACP